MNIFCYFNLINILKHFPIYLIIITKTLLSKRFEIDFYHSMSTEWELNYYRPPKP